MFKRAFLVLLLVVSCASAATVSVPTHPVQHALEHLTLRATAQGNSGITIIAVATVNANDVAFDFRDVGDNNLAQVMAAVDDDASCLTATNAICAASSNGTASNALTWAGAAGRFCAASCSLNSKFAVVTQVK
jgi:hypothetical protein